MTGRLFTAAAFASLLFAAGSSAQSAEEPAVVLEPVPEPEGGVFPQTSEIPEPGREKRFGWSLDVGVPIFLNVDRDIFRPGFDTSWAGGLDIEYFVFGLGAGLMFTPIDLTNFVDDFGNSGGRRPMVRFYLFPQVRFQFPNRSLVLPYLSGAFDANFWSIHSSHLVCDSFYCGERELFRFTPGFTGQVGLGFHLKRGIHIDVGMKYSFSGKGVFFDSGQWWLTPYVGVLARRLRP